MTTDPGVSPEETLDPIARFIHLGLMIFGVLAWLTGDWAGSYKHPRHLGFTIHSWLGIGTAVFMGLRLCYGLVGPAAVRFTQWVPYTRERLQWAWEDVLTLLKLKLPQRPTHKGLSGLVHALGLLGFSWMALTGSLMFFYLTPGSRATGMLRLIKEIHEAGYWLVTIFLALHVGAVVLHALTGDHVWRKMVFLKDQEPGSGA
jgi:cytochrome b